MKEHGEGAVNARVHNEYERGGCRHATAFVMRHAKLLKILKDPPTLYTRKVPYSKQHIPYLDSIQ